MTDIRLYGHKVEGGVEAQATKALQNLKAVVEAGGGELGKVVKTTVRPSFFHTLPHMVRSREKGAGAERARGATTTGRCSCTTWTTSRP